MPKFRIGDKVFAKWPENDEYYSATIIEYNKTKKRYLVRFRDADEQIISAAGISKKAPPSRRNLSRHVRALLREVRSVAAAIEGLKPALAQATEIETNLTKLQSDADQLRTRINGLRHELDMLRAPERSSGSRRSALADFENYKGPAWQLPGNPGSRSR